MNASHAQLWSLDYEQSAGLRVYVHRISRVPDLETYPMTMQTPSTSLLQRVADGDSSAVSAVVDTYGALVWSLARRFFGRCAEAEDAVQNAFIAVWKSADRYDPSISSESTFIAMIARRQMIDELRQKGRRIDFHPLDSAPHPENQSDDHLANVEQAAMVLRAIDALDPPQPEVIRRSLQDGKSHAEIAHEMDLPLGTVKTHLRRGLIAVRRVLGIHAPADRGILA